MFGIDTPELEIERDAPTGFVGGTVPPTGSNKDTGGTVTIYLGRYVRERGESEHKMHK